MNMNTLNLNPKSTSTLLAILFFSLLALAVITPAAIAQVTAVSTDATSYMPGDTVTISGTAPADALVALQVTNPMGTSILMSTVTADSTGAFTRTFKLADDVTEGTYTVSASYGGAAAKTATFEVSTTAPPPPPPSPADPWDADIDALSARITTLENEVTSLNTDVASLQDNVASLQDNVASLQDNVASLQSGVAALQGATTMYYIAIGVAILAIIIAFAAIAKSGKKA
jgi:flagellin-like hook-associated protein FlgL